MGCWGRTRHAGRHNGTPVLLGHGFSEKVRHTGTRVPLWPGNVVRSTRQREVVTNDTVPGPGTAALDHFVVEG